MIRFSLFIFIALALISCTVGPNYHRPEVKTPKQWSITSPAASSPSPDKWWQLFHDPVLNQLIKNAISANLDLKLALQRIIDARALRTETIAAGLPSIGASSNVTRRFNNISMGSSTGSSTPGGIGFGKQVSNIFQMGFDTQWELDFFGGVQRAIEAADANVDYEIENSRDVLLTLLGDVARNYIDLRANQQLIAITKANIDTQQDTLNLTQIRQQSGFSTMLEVSQQQAQVATTSAQLSVYETNVKLAIHALGLLLAKEPEALTSILSRPGKLPVIKNFGATELPSELLQRRPDIRRAERAMAKANADVGIATAALYPKFNLSAFIGSQNAAITNYTPIGKSWSMAGSLTMPIFNWGKLNAEIKSKKSQYEQTFLSYQSTVLMAFKEVEDALVSHSNELKRQNNLRQAVSANQLAVLLANERYKRGLTTFLDVLESQRSLYLSQSSLLDSEAKVSSDLVALYKALGGGWQTEPSVNDGCYHYADKSRLSQLADFIKSSCSK